LCEINADSLADALAFAINLNETQYQALCEAAYATARDHYSTGPVRQKIADMLDLYIKPQLIHGIKEH